MAFSSSTPRYRNRHPSKQLHSFLSFFFLTTGVDLRWSVESTPRHAHPCVPCIYARDCLKTVCLSRLAFDATFAVVVLERVFFFLHSKLRARDVGPPRIGTFSRVTVCSVYMKSAFSSYYVPTVSVVPTLSYWSTTYLMYICTASFFVE